MSNLRGRTAVVTGSTTGIGLAIAQSFAKAGVNIVINGFGNPDDIEKERSRIEADFGVKAIYSPADMTRPAEIGEMIGFGEKTFGSVDILVNNAGIQFVSPIEEFPIEKWDAIIAINLSSAFPRYSYGRAGHEEARAGAHHQHRLGALAGRLALRPSRSSSRRSRSPATVLARDTSGRRWLRSRFLTQ
jgi:NAD(P)-dependent dehydrogenase (short-subunit alcohol dehydrogenase family)